jgi:four helix bundle protein
MGQTYRDLVVWQKAMQFVTDLYRITQEFPREELYGLTSQMRRAAISIPGNIAAGQARYSQKEFRQFLSHARGSLVEVETQLGIAVNLGYLTPSRGLVLTRQMDELGRLLNGLVNSLQPRTENRELRTPS